MSDRSFIRPIRIPGKRFVLTKNMIEEAQNHTKSNMEAARWLKVSYNTYKRWAKYYDVFERYYCCFEVVTLFYSENVCMACFSNFKSVHCSQLNT